MKTLVIQSYRTYDVPSWITLCIASVKNLCSIQQWDYEFKGDSFLSMAPECTIKQCGSNKYAVTDICRLTWISDSLYEYDMVIWMDADVLIFNPEIFTLTSTCGYGFAHELLFVHDGPGVYNIHESVNNAVMMFERGQNMLDEYYYRVVAILKASNGTPARCALGPELLQQMKRAREGVLYGIGLFTYELMFNMSATIKYSYEQIMGSSLFAANLCHFKRDKANPTDRVKFDIVYDKAVDWLVRGEYGTEKDIRVQAKLSLSQQCTSPYHMLRS